MADEQVATSEPQKWKVKLELFDEAEPELFYTKASSRTDLIAAIKKEYADKCVLFNRPFNEILFPFYFKFNKVSRMV